MTEQLDARSDNNRRDSHMEHLVESEAADASASLKYLAVVHGGVAVSLGTWLQSCFAANASSAQQALVTPIIYALCLALTGLCLCLLLPLIRMRGAVETARLVMVDKKSSKVTVVQSNSDTLAPASGKLTMVIVKTGADTTAAVRRQTRIALAWAYGWHTVAVGSWAILAAAVVVIVRGAFSARALL
jgi:hypothetical protein